jgi:hypothetical protein
LNRCPECGWEYIKTAREIAQEKGELEEVRSERWYLCTGCGHKGRLPDGRHLKTFALVNGHIDAFSCARCQCVGLVSLASKYDNGDDSKRREKFLEWHQEALDKGYKSGYASVKFRRLYGRWPQKKWIRTAAGLSSKDQYVNLDEVERLEAEVS